MYIEKVIPWESSKWIAPPPHEIARIRRAAGTHEDTAGAPEKDLEAAGASEHAVNGNAVNGNVPATNGVPNGVSQEKEKEEQNGDSPAPEANGPQKDMQ